MSKRLSEESKAWSNAERYSRRFLRLIEVKGNSVSERDPFVCAQVRALMSLTIEPLIPLAEGHVLHSLISRALHMLAISEQERGRSGSFEALFKGLLGKYTGSIPEQVRVLTFLHLKPEFSEYLGSPSWKGVDIQVFTWDDASDVVKRIADLPERVYQETGIDFDELKLPQHFTPLMLQFEARSDLEVSNLTEDVAEPLRACINFALGAGTLYYSFGERKPPAECMRYPMMLMLKDDGSYRNVACPREKSLYKDNPSCSREKIQLAARIHSKLDCLPGRLREVATDVFLKWQKALDCDDAQLSYLFLWQGIETAALQGFSSRFLEAGTIVDRAARLIRARKHERDLLQGFADERGRIAHHGCRTESLELYLNVLKILVERCFSGLVVSRRVQSFDDLLHIYGIDEASGTLG
jgi:hypothetical protein